MNALIPIDYQGFHTSEAIFDTAWKDPLRRFRMTRKGWGEFFGAKHPQKYIDNLKERHPELPDGIPLTVRVTEDYNWKGHSALTVRGQCLPERTRELTVFTLGIWDGYQYAVESTLSKAKHFLHRFPAFFEAVRTNSLIPDKMLSKIIGYAPYSSDRSHTLRQVAQQNSESQTTIYRRIKRLSCGQPIYQNCPGMRKGYLHKKHRDKYVEVISLRADGVKIKDIAAHTNVPLATVYRWI